MIPDSLAIVSPEQIVFAFLISLALINFPLRHYVKEDSEASSGLTVACGPWQRYEEPASSHRSLLLQPER